MLKTSIFNNILPPKSFYDTIPFKSTAKTNKTSTNLGQFLNITHDKEVIISNPIVKRSLEQIDYWGPKYSHCPSCRNRNLSFYETLHPKESLRLIDYIKSVKK
jgi:hypothetical protein